MTWLRRARDVLLRKAPAPDDERTRKALLIEAVKVESKAAISRADRSLKRKVADGYADLKLGHR